MLKIKIQTQISLTWFARIHNKTTI